MKYEGRLEKMSDSETRKDWSLQGSEPSKTSGSQIWALDKLLSCLSSLVATALKAPTICLVKTLANWPVKLGREEAAGSAVLMSGRSSSSMGPSLFSSSRPPGNVWEHGEGEFRSTGLALLRQAVPKGIVGGTSPWPVFLVPPR